MTPRNEDNFLIELTPTQFESLKNAYKYADNDGYEVLHYSPYWKPTQPNKDQPPKLEESK